MAALAGMLHRLVGPAYQPRLDDEAGLNQRLLQLLRRVELEVQREALLLTNFPSLPPHGCLI